MATRDFRSQQIRTTQIIASGSSDPTVKPSLLIYSASSATNDQGAFAAAMLNGVGDDVWLFIDGSPQEADNENVLFGGNVIVSGTLTGSAIGSFPGSSLTLSSKDDMNFIIDSDGGDTSRFSFKASTSASEIASIDEAGNLQIDGDLTLDGGDIKNSDAQVTISIDASANTTLAGALRVPGEIQHVGDLNTKIGFDTKSVKITADNIDIAKATDASFIVNEDNANVDFEVRSNAANQRAIHVDASKNTVKFLDTNNTDLDAMNLRDVSFYVKGTPGAHQAYVMNGSATGRGVALFTGDVVVSGTLYAEKQIMDVDMLVNSGSSLILSQALHMQSVGAASTDAGHTDIFVPQGDGALFVATGSLFTRLSNNETGVVTEVRIGQNYIAGNGMTDTIVNPNTTFHMSIDAFSGSLTSGLQTSDAIAIMDDSEANNATKKMTLANFFTETADNGLKYDSTTVGYKTDDAVVAHLTGSEFNGHVGVTGSFGVDGDISIDSGHVLYLNGRGGDVFIQAPNANALTIDGDNIINMVADNSVTIAAKDAGSNITLEAGDTNNFVTFGSVRTTFNTEDSDIDFKIKGTTTDPLFIDANDGSIILGAASISAGADLVNKGYGADVRIMLSGSADSKDLTTRGVVLIPGDAVVSGTLFYANDASSESYISHPRNGLSRDLSIGQRALELSLQSITGSADIAKTDSLAFIDQDASNATKKGTIDSLVTALAGSGLSNSSSQLALTSNSLTVAAGDGLKDGGSVNLGGSVTLNIEPSDFAGTGLEDDGSDNLRISAAAAGNGLNGGGGSALSVDDGVGLKIGSSNELKTDDAIVAHLSGSQFNGNVGITGSLGVVGDISLATEDILYLNGLGGDVFLRGFANTLTIDGDDSITVLSDTNTQIRAGINSINFNADAAEFNTNNEDVDFEVNTNTHNATLFVDGADESIILGAQDFTTTPAASDLAAKGYGQDVKIMLSGSKNTMGTTTRGVVLVPGDLVVSGTLADGTGNRINFLSINENGTFSTAPSATGTNAIAIGNNTVASGHRSIAIGSGISTNEATGQNSAALGGENITASGDYSAVLGGHNNTASGHHSKVIGRDSAASGEASIAIGGNLTVPESNTIALGSGTNHAQKIVASGSFEVTGSATIDGAVTLADSDGDVILGNTADLIIPTFIKHKADTNTYFQFNVDRIRLVTNGVAKSDFTTDQVLFLSGGNSTSPDPAAGTDVNFFVSGSIGSKDTATKGTGVFGGDLHISGALSGPTQYGLIDNSVRMFRDGSTMKFVDGITSTKTLEELASVAASTSHFIGVHGNNSQVSRIHTSASIAFAGDLNNFVSNLAANGVGSDVYFFVSGTLGGKDGSTRHTALFGGDVVVSGSAHLADITGSFIKATGPIVAAGNIIKNSNNDTVARFHNAAPGVMFGSDALPQTTVDIRLADNTVLASGVDGNDFSNYNIALRNNSTTTNAFAGIAFDVHDEDDPDSIGASIAVLRDSTANSTNHDANMVFMTNDAGDDGLTERLRITHDGKVGVGIDTPSRALDVNGDVMIRGNNILDSGGADVITFDGSQNMALAKSLNVTLDITGSAFQATTGNYFAAPGQSLGLYSPHHVVVKLDTDNNGAAEFQIDNGAGTEVFVVNESGDLQIDGDLTVSGNDIKDSGPTTVFTFDGSGNVSNNAKFSGIVEFTRTGGASLKVAKGVGSTANANTLITLDGSSGRDIHFLPAGVEYLALENPSSGQKKITFNENGQDVDFRVEAQSNAGIGTPSHGNVDADHAIFMLGETGQTGFGVNSFGADDRIRIKGVTTTIDPYSSKVWAQLTGSVDDGRLDLYANNSVTARINANGMSMLGGDGTEEPSLLIVRRDSTTSQNDLLGGIGFDSSDGNVPTTILNASAFIAGYASESHGTGDKGGYLVFGTTATNDNDDTASQENLRIENTQITSQIPIDVMMEADPVLSLTRIDSDIDNDNIIGQLMFNAAASAEDVPTQLGEVAVLAAQNNMLLGSDCPTTMEFKVVRDGTNTLVTAATLDGGGTLGITDVNATGHISSPQFQSLTDGDLTVRSDGNITFIIDGDSDETSQSFSFKNNFSTEIANLDESGNLQIDGDLTVSGNDIKSSTGATAITLSSNDVSIADGLTTGGDITVEGGNVFIERTTNAPDLRLRLQKTTISSGDDIGQILAYASENGTDYHNVGYILFEADEDFDYGGNNAGSRIKFATNTNGSSSPTNKMELDNAGNLQIDGDLTVSGGDIFGPTNADLRIRSDADVKIYLDDDNDGTNTFDILNGAGLTMVSINESGHIECSAVHVGSSIQTSRSTFEGTTSSTTGDSIVLIKHAATNDANTKVALDIKQAASESNFGGTVTSLNYDFDTSEIFIQFTDGDDDILGDIDNEVTYNNFTGAHISYHESMNVNDDSWQDTWRRGMILRSSGVLLSEPGGMSTALVGVEITDS